MNEEKVQLYRITIRTVQCAQHNALVLSVLISCDAARLQSPLPQPDIICIVMTVRETALGND